MNKKYAIILLFLAICVTSTYSINYTGIEHFDITIPDIIVDSPTYELIYNVTTNIGDARDLIISGQMQSSRTSPSTGLSNLYIRMDLNGITKFNDLIATINGPDDVKISTRHLNLVNYQDNVTIEIYARDRGVGGVLIDNFEMHIFTDKSLNGYDINYNAIKENYTFNNAVYTNIRNFTLTDVNNSKVLLDFHEKINASASTTLYCYFNDIDGNYLGNYIRYLSSSIDNGFSGISVIDNISRTGNVTFLLYCKNSNNVPVTHYSLGHILELGNSIGEKIYSDQIKSPHTTISQPTNVTILKNYSPKIGNETHVISNLIFKSFGASTTQTVSSLTYYDGVLSNTYSRYLRSNLDFASVRYYSSYDNATLNNYTLLLTPGVGESLNYSSSLIVFDVSEINKTINNIAPIFTILNPLNNSYQWYDEQDINISVVDVNGNFEIGGYCSVNLTKNDDYLYKTDFESGTFEGWENVGGDLLDSTLNTTSCYSGNYCFLFNEAQHDQNIFNSEFSNSAGNYTYSLYLKWLSQSDINDSYIGNSRFTFYINNITGQAIVNEYKNESAGTFNSDWNRIVILEDRSNGVAKLYLNGDNVLNSTTEYLPTPHMLLRTDNNNFIIYDDIYMCSGLNINCGLSNSTLIDDNFTSNTKINYTDFDFGEYILDFTCYDNLNTSRNKQIYITLNCTENWVIDNDNCQSDYKTYITYTDTNSCGTTNDLPINNDTITDCTCIYDRYRLLGYITPYCGVNSTCVLVADTNSNSTFESGMNTTVLIDGVEYDMTYVSEQWQEGIFSDVVEDVNIIMTSKVIEDGNFYCSNNVTGVIKFRVPYNVTLSFYRQSYLNDSYKPKLYVNDFNYVYLVLEDTFNPMLIGSGFDSYAKDINDAVRNLNEFLPFDNDMLDFSKVTPYVSAYSDSRIYHWGEYENGIAKIELFEDGSYSVNVIQSNIKVTPNLLNEFYRPFSDDALDFDNEILKNYEINSTHTHHDIAANILELQGWALLPKVFWSAFAIMIFLVALIIAALIPAAGKYLVPAVLAAGTPILLIILKTIWGISIFGLI